MKICYTFKDLTFSFMSNQRVLFKNVQYSFMCNALTMIKGKNGCGKSTLLKLFQAQDVPGKVQGTFVTCKGEYSLMSVEHKAFVLNSVTYVDQQFDNLLVPDLTVLENLSCAAFTTYPSCISFVKKVKMPSIMKDFLIDTNTPVQLLSGGQRQILSIVMALQKNPEVLLLDEPTAALDYKNSVMVIKFLQQLIKERNITVIMICHDPDLYGYADAIVEMSAF